MKFIPLCVLTLTSIVAYAQNKARNSDNEVVTSAFYYKDSVVFAASSIGEMHLESPKLIAPNHVYFDNALHSISNMEAIEKTQQKEDIDHANAAIKAAFKQIDLMRAVHAKITSGDQQTGAVFVNSSKEWSDPSLRLLAFANFSAVKQDESDRLSLIDYTLRTWRSVEKELKADDAIFTFYDKRIVKVKAKLNDAVTAEIIYRTKNDDVVIEQMKLRLRDPMGWNMRFKKAKSVVAELDMCFYKYGVAGLSGFYIVEKTDGAEQVAISLLPLNDYINLRYMPPTLKGANLRDLQIMSSDDALSVLYWKRKFNATDFVQYEPEIGDDLIGEIAKSTGQPWVKLKELIELSKFGKSEEEDYDEDWMDAKERILLQIEVVSFDYQIGKDEYIDRCFWIFNKEESNLPYSLVLDNYTETELQDILTHYHGNICGKEAFQILGNTFSQINGSINGELLEYFYE
tara:strand:- start:461295 stop:462668 length:1374 start_codon:yes stop_codon:yes gene_type:complete